MTDPRPPHEISAWLRAELNASIARFDRGEISRCEHPADGLTIMALWAGDRAVCVACSSDWTDIRGVCDRCARVGRAHVATCVTASRQLETMYALCGGCIRKEESRHTPTGTFSTEEQS